MMSNDFANLNKMQKIKIDITDKLYCNHMLILDHVSYLAITNLPLYSLSLHLAHNFYLKAWENQGSSC